MKNKFIPHIPKPCPKKWEDLQGGGNRRFCDHCQHHVHDITDMGDQERMALFSDPKKRVCITYLKQPDQEPARTSWMGRLISRPRNWIRAALAMFVPLGMAGCETKNCGRTVGVPLQPKDVPVPKETPRAIGEACPIDFPVKPEEQGEIPFGNPEPHKPGFIRSPYSIDHLIDARGVQSGTKFIDPFSGKMIKMP